MTWRLLNIWRTHLELIATRQQTDALLVVFSSEAGFSNNRLSPSQDEIFKQVLGSPTTWIKTLKSMSPAKMRVKRVCMIVRAVSEGRPV